MSRVRRVAVIVNPIAGPDGHRAGVGATRVDRAHRTLTRLGIAGEVVLSARPGHAAALAADLVGQGVDLIIAWGGDGTINEVARPLIGRAVPLGVVRSGSGDGFGRTLGVPVDPDDALRRAVTGPTSAIDVGQLDGRPFLNVAGIGFDATVARAFNQGRRRGARSYFLRTLQTIWTYRATRYRLRLEHESSDATRLVIAFANGREYGGRLMLAVDADPADGWLDAVVVDDGSPLRQLWRMRRLAVGLRRPAEGIFRYRVQQASVSGDRLVCHVDGETFETTGTVAVQIQPAALLVAGYAGRRPDAASGPASTRRPAEPA